MICSFFCRCDDRLAFVRFYARNPGFTHVLRLIFQEYKSNMCVRVRVRVTKQA